MSHPCVFNVYLLRRLPYTLNGRSSIVDKARVCRLSIAAHGAYTANGCETGKDPPTEERKLK